MTRLGLYIIGLLVLVGILPLGKPDRQAMAREYLRNAQQPRAKAQMLEANRRGIEPGVYRPCVASRPSARFGGLGRRFDNGYAHGSGSLRCAPLRASPFSTQIQPFLQELLRGAVADFVP